MSKIRAIDADGHVQEPDAAWERYLAPRYRPFAPRSLRAVRIAAASFLSPLNPGLESASISATESPARNRRIDSHRAWVVRSYVLVWAFVLCRLASRIPSLPEFGSGAALIWLSWIVPLFICEVVLQWPAGRSQALLTDRSASRAS